MPRKPKFRCFIIMPFSTTSETHTEEYWTKHFETFLKLIIDPIPNIKAYRSEPLRGDILKEIIRELMTAEVVVADITDFNPNVFWELGVRQSFKHSTITIAEEGTVLPFDISGKSTLFYSPKDHIKNANFTRKLKNAIKDCLKNPDKPDSYILETISGRGSLYEIIRREENLRRLDALNSEIIFNLKIFNSIHFTFEEEKSTIIPTERFRTSAIKLFITNRYVNLSKEEYQLLERYYDQIRILNGQLRVIEYSKDETREYLQNRKKQDQNLLDNISKFIKEIIQKI